ncbi:hypothetical protein AWC22_11815 [Mycobacterium riyadhense]|uniref:Uncharacterized protein n=1 Tax=Mycobacterium riyadhense TaxID=486698 RepID=A0A1X2DD56_9MYCO|nr:hypothetical protein AWC22_11815 [Mycobacterium riyadhense]VTO95015.1 hypothetical protein BIN_B_00490 [Mycobacterium riyadhense]
MIWTASLQMPLERGVRRLPVDMLFFEFLVHAWDFAIATGRHVVVSEPVSEYVLGVARKVIGPARNCVGFAEPVAVGSLAPVLDRLIACTGRRPTGISAATN